jgi:hypothetical protein
MLSPANFPKPSGLDHEEQSERLLEISRGQRSRNDAQEKSAPAEAEEDGWTVFVPPLMRGFDTA